ncbi:MAG: hypothetical protein GX444_21615 [Myxococcales bacterium]|nr:hypothetical protein [Myxococcales bacterium]
MTTPEALLHSLKKIEAVCTTFGIVSLSPQIKAATDALSDGGIVDVAIFGQFKSGKSSFLNSLFGREIVPVDVLPTTAVVTRIGYGPTAHAVVRYLSGKSEDVSSGSVAEYVTESENPDNRKQVAMVEVESPTLAKFQGVRFVDTPGLGSLFRHNTQASLDWLPRVGAAIVAVSIDHPLSEQDLQLLDELARHTPEILVLLSKADIVTSGQTEKIIDFTREQLDKYFGRTIPVFPFSIRPSFENQRDALREFLISRVVENHETRFSEIMSHKVRALVGSCREYLTVALQAASADEEALRELRGLLSREKDDFDQIRNEVWLVANDHKTKVQNASFERFRVYRGELTEKLLAELKIKAPEWKGHLSKTSTAYKAWLESTLEIEMKTLSMQGEDFLAPYLTQSQAAIARSVRAFQDRLAQAIQKALKTTLTGAQFQGEIEEPARPDVRVGKTFDIPLDLLWFIIPMLIFRPLVNRHLQKQIPWEVEKNLSRLSAQWAGATNRCIDDLAKQAMEFIRHELAVIERLVGDLPAQGKNVQDALRELATLTDGPDVSRADFSRG